MQPADPRRSVAAAALAALAASVAPACALDDRATMVKPDPVVLATFESGTMQADDARLGEWSPYSYGPPVATMSSSVVSFNVCPNSNWCLSLDWQLADLPDGSPSTGGVGDRVDAVDAMDLSGYTRMLFIQRGQHQGSCQAASDLTVIFQCGAMQSEVRATVKLSPDWSDTVLPFSQLTGPAECLREVTALLFQTEVTLADGACASGSLVIDNVILR